MLPNATFLALKNANIFYCESCSFACSKKSNYDKHILTTKHKNATFMLHNATSNDEYGAKTTSGIKKCQKNALSDIVCSCGRIFQHRSSLWRHKKTCFNNVEENIVTTIDNTTVSDSGIFGLGNGYDNKTDFKELVILLLKENKEIQKSFVDLIPHIKGNNNTNSNNCISNTTNNHNNAHTNNANSNSNSCDNAILLLLLYSL